MFHVPIIHAGESRGEEHQYRKEFRFTKRTLGNQIHLATGFTGSYRVHASLGPALLQTHTEAAAKYSRLQDNRQHIRQ